MMQRIRVTSHNKPIKTLGYKLNAFAKKKEPRARIAVPGRVNAQTTDNCPLQGIRSQYNGKGGIMKKGLPVILSY